MNIINDVLIESRLALRNRWTLALIAILLLSAVWGYISTYQQALHRNGMLNTHEKKVYGAKFEDFVRSDKNMRYDRELFQLLHPAAGPNYVMSIFAIFGPLLAAIWGAVILGSEFSWRTAKVRAVNSGWHNIILSKIFLILTAGLVLGLIASVIGITAGNLAWSSIGSSTDIAKLIREPNIIQAYWKQLMVVTLGISFYGFLGACLSLIARSVAIGAISGFILPYIELYLSKWWLPQAVYGGLMAKNFAYFSGGIIGIRPIIFDTQQWLAWLCMLLWCLLLAGSMLYISVRQEIT